MLRSEFGTLVLLGLGIAPQDNAITGMVAWQQGENCNAQFNPFASELVYGQCTNYNPQTVKNYATLTDGLIATCQTLNNGLYGDIVSLLASNASPNEIAAAIDASQWGTKDVVSVVAGGIYDNAPVNAPGVDRAWVSSSFPWSAPAAPVVEPTPAPEPAPVDPSTYVVKPGDTLWGIAQRLDVPENALYNRNATQIESVARAHGLMNSQQGRYIWPGEVLDIP